MDRDIENEMVQREMIAEWLASLTDAQREAVRWVVAFAVHMEAMMDRDIENEMVQRETIAEWLASLTDAQRDAVRLVWIEGYTQEEAAEMLGVTREAIRNRLMWARKHANGCQNGLAIPVYSRGLL